MSKELEAFGLIKRTCELYMQSKSYLIGSDIIENQISEALDTIKAVLQKQQELPEPFKTGVDIGVIKPKQYLKWDDLEFSYGIKTQKVRMGDTLYKIAYMYYDNNKEVQLLSEDEKLLYISFVGKYKDNVQLFNDLHLERVEE